MKITYIHHSSFLVELDNISLLFDYFEGELPELDRDKPLAVFASHRHGDHFSKVIFELARQYPNAGYILSDDIWNRQVPEELHSRVLFMGPGEARDAGPLSIKAFQSTDEGVAFLIQAEGKTIYHAGDLNNWVWAGEPEADNRRMSQAYHRQLELMAGIKIDVAFVPLDPRQENDFYLGLDDFMQSVGAEVVFPMHFWGDFQTIQRFKKLPCAAGYKEKIQEITCKGESFLL